MLADMYASTNDVDVPRADPPQPGCGQRPRSASRRREVREVARTARSRRPAAGRGTRGAELEELYRSESDKDVKQRILNSLIAANATDKLAAIARTREGSGSAAAWRFAISARRIVRKPPRRCCPSTSRTRRWTRRSRGDPGALDRTRTAAVLVTLAKAEKNNDLQTDIVRPARRTMTNRCTEARDYMQETLDK